VTPRVTRESRDRLAGILASSGAALGILVGLLDMAVGPSIRDWVGNKLDTSILGLATVALSLIALAAATSWQRAGGREGGRRLATVLALTVPATICFTTIGRLWYLPGALLLGSAAVILATSTRRELAGAVTERRWRRALVVVLGGYYVFLGADALGLAGAFGIVGGLVVWMALAVRSESRSVTLALIALGALPFAIATWWSVVTPLIALLMLVIGAAAARPTIARQSSVQAPRTPTPA
jgi:hypothetical protein